MTKLNWATKLALVVLLAAPLALGGGYLLNHLTVPNRPLPAAPGLPAQHETSASLLTIYTNQTRAAYRLPRLTETVELNEGALRKCTDMETRGYWAHSLNNEPFNKFYPEGLIVGENLARDYLNDELVTAAWNNSPGHFANIINPDFSKVGIAHCDGIIHNLVVQAFQ